MAIVIGVIIITAVIVRAVDNKSGDYLAENNGGQERCPLDMVFVTSENNGFCIDRYESSPGSECPYKEPENQRESRMNLDYPNCKPSSQAAKAPWRFISQNQAAMACAKAGKRLPTNKEWLQAALGTPDKNDSWSGDDCHVNKNWDTQPGLSGSGKNCVSAAGAYDMLGNAWEWVEGTVVEGIYKEISLSDSGFINAVDENGMPSETIIDSGDPNYYYDYFWIKKKGTRGIARGGYWNNKSDAGQYAVYIVSPPSFAGIGMGFRCVK